MEITSHLLSKIPQEEKDQYKLDILTSWLECKAWAPSDARMLLGGLDPDCSDRAGAWRVLPGVDYKTEQQEMDISFKLIDGLRLTTGTPSDIINTVLSAGVTIPWEATIAMDPVLNKYLPPERRLKAISQTSNPKRESESKPSSHVISELSQKGGLARLEKHLAPSYKILDAWLEQLRLGGFNGCWAKNGRLIKARVTAKLELHNLPTRIEKGRPVRIGAAAAWNFTTVWLKKNNVPLQK